MAPGESPPFHEIGAQHFQELCRDLFSMEQNIATCDIYGVLGQWQDGIDLLARRTGNGGIEVGQCKCYKKFVKANIVEVTEKFFASWDSKWSGVHVTRFILFVACDVDNRVLQIDIDRQIRIFRKYRVEYELWSAATLRNKLRAHPGIVSTYCQPPEHWIKVICGEAQPVALAPNGQPGRRSVVNDMLACHLDELAAVLTDHAEQAIVSIRGAWHEGRTGEAQRRLAEVRNVPAAWQVLSNEVKAKVLRLDAWLDLATTGQIERAQKLAYEAHALASTEADARIEAVIAHVQGNSAAALQLLEGRKERESLILRCSLLLELNQISQCRTLLEHSTLRVAPDADTHRLDALAALASREVDRARDAIRQALELQPRWESVRFAAAMIDYVAALSPVVVPAHLVAWPEPVDWDVVRRDDASLARLRIAGRTFRELAERPLQPKEARQMLQAWALACMANDPECQTEATRYCRTLLAAEPSDFRAVAWAAARRYSDELEPSVKALRALVTKRTASIEHILALVTCHIAARTTRKAISLLKKTRPLFDLHGQGALWLNWHVRAVALGGSTESALQDLEAAGDQPELEMARTSVLQIRASQTGDWHAVVDYLESIPQLNRGPHFLLEMCHAKARMGSWDYIAERTDQLIGEVSTSQAVELSAVAAYNAQRFDLCLSLLDDHRGQFSHGSLPANLRRLRVECQRASGRILQTIAEAEYLVKRYPSGDNWFTVTRLYSQLGDQKRAVVAARQLRGRGDSTSAHLLGAADLIQFEDRGLAGELVVEAIDRGLGDEAVAPALDLAFRLGIEGKAHKLLPRLADLAQASDSSIEIISIDSFVRRNLELDERLRVRDENFRAGLIPIHFLLEGAHWSPVDIYHGLLDSSVGARNLSEKPAILIRHGERSLAAHYPAAAECRLHLDITAVLVAARLDILGHVQQAFGKVLIPNGLIIALQQMRARLSPVQPSRLPLWRQIVSLADAGELTAEEHRPSPVNDNAELAGELGEAWTALFAAARGCNGYMVDFLPKQKRDGSGAPIALPDGAEESLVTCRSVVEALRQLGPLSSDAYDKALKILGTQAPIGPVPQPGACLFFHANTVEVLAQAGVLPDACRLFRVVVERRELEHASASVRAHDECQVSAGWLAGVIDQLRQGVTDQKLEMMADQSLNQATEPLGANLVVTQCLFDLLSFNPASGDVVWCDDRYLTAFSNHGDALIVGVNEILQWLVASGAITRPDYFAKLMVLREGNARFIPIQADEILYHLQKARVESGQVVETRELATLRRYVAGCLLPESGLQQPSGRYGNPNHPGEVAYPVSVHRAAIQAIAALWRVGDFDEAMSRAEWIVANLFTSAQGVLAFLPASRRQQDHVGYGLAGCDLSLLLVAGMDLLRPEDTVPTLPRQRYLAWVYRRYIWRRLVVDPGLLAAVAGQLTVVFTGVLDTEESVKASDEVPGSVARPGLRAFIADLPAAIRGQLELDRNFMARLGLNFRSIVTVGKTNFDETDFWRAAAVAVNGQAASLRPVGSHHDVALEPGSLPGHEYWFSFRDPATGLSEHIADDQIGLLHNSPSIRSISMRRCRDWFDCSDAEYALILAELETITEPARRIRYAEDRRRSSAAIYYANLGRYVQNTSELVSANLRPPSVQGLLRHCRLQSFTGGGATFRDMMAFAAGSLIEQEGVNICLERLGGLPVPLDELIGSVLGALSPADRRTQIKGLLAFASSPVTLMHILAVLRRFQRDEPAYGRLARRLTSRLVGPLGQTGLNAFVVVLGWVYESFCDWEEMKEIAPQLRIALPWLHATRLFTAFVRAGATCEQISDVFQPSDTQVLLELFEIRKPLWYDVAHPRRVSSETLLLAGIAYGIREELGVTLETSIRHKIHSELLLDNDGELRPKPSLLRDASLMLNALGSFLGDDRGSQIAVAVGPEEARLFDSATLHTAVGEVLARLNEECQDLSAWMVLSTVLGDLSPPRELVDQLSQVIRKTNFAILAAAELPLGVHALRFAARQAAHVGDAELSRSLLERLIIATRSIGEQLSRTTEDRDTLLAAQQRGVDALLHASVDIAHSIVGDHDPARVFADIVSRLLAACPAFASLCRPVIQRLAEGLPMRQSRHFWLLVQQARALDRD